MEKRYINKDVLTKVNNINSIEELQAIVKENNIDISEEKVAETYKLLTKKDIESISDEELENVSGGSYMRGCCTYSSDTNDKGQHPLIVLRTNYCKLYEHNYYYDENSSHICKHCLYIDEWGIGDNNDSLTCYCKRRSDEDDPLNPR